MPLQLGDKLFDPYTKELADRDGTNICLRPQSLEVLALLAARLGEVVSRDEIYATIWRHVAVTDDSLTQCIADIRKAIGDTDHRILRTLPKKAISL